MTIDLAQPQRSDILLGNVISTDASPTFFRADFRVEPGQSLSPGSYVAIQAEGAGGDPVLIIARVEDMHEVNPHEDALSSTLRDVLPFEPRYAREGSSTVIYRAAKAEPLEQAVLGADGEVLRITAVDTLAPAGAPVFRAGPDLVVAALGMEPNPNDGLHVGAAYGDPGTPLTLNKSIIQRHVFIAGGIGSGKSYTRGVLGEELHAWGVPQVNIDVNGEMVDAAVELGGVNLVPGRDGFTLPLSALSSADVVDAVPSINRGTNMETLLRFAHESLAKQVQTGRRRHFSVDDLVAHIDECAKTLEMTSKATVEPTKLRTGSLNRLAFLGQPYDWVAALQPGAFVNIDCRSLSITELRLIAASVARDLQSLARQRAIPFTVLSIDEFHLVAPADDAAVTTQVLREIARVGRHYRLGLVLTTQSPADVDKSILKRLLTRFLHAIEPDQLTSLRGVFSDASDDLIRTLPKLPQGVCIVTGAFETVRHATVVQVRPRRTTHGGATPDIWADFSERGWGGKSDGPGAK
jgi:DNA helicase HerA-like ATPase